MAEIASEQPRDASCYHCALPIPPGTSFAATIGGTTRAMCCPGCVAVAELIAASGLDAYYRFRERPADTPAAPSPERTAELARYDHPSLQRTFVRRDVDGIVHCTLSLDGVRCGACVWLIEEALRRRPGVRDVAVNAVSARAEIAWDESATRLSAILAELARLGYQARPYRPDWEEGARHAEYQAALRRLGLAGLGAMQVMMYAVALYAGALEGMAEPYRDFLRWVSGIVAAPVVVFAGRPFFSNAWRDLRQGRVGMDVPVALAIGLTFAASLVAAWLGTGDVYFESVCMFVFLLALGRFIEMRTRHRAATTVERALRRPPACATRLAAESGGEELVGAYELVPGDHVLVKPGETVPADGRVLEGEGWVNEAMLTGEHWPRAKRPGDPVVGGTQNGESPLTVAIERVGADTTLAAVVRMVDGAGRARPRLARVADRVARIFVPRVLLLAGLAAIAWLFVDPARAPWIALAVVVVSCPCALSLATPVALTAANGTLVRTGLLATREHVLEGLGNTTHVVFDKTGTLTAGEVRLLRAVPIGGARLDDCLAVARALESRSSHPIAAAFTRGPLPARGTRLRVADATAIAGKGIEGVVANVTYRLGVPEWAAALVADAVAAPPPGDGATWVLLAASDGLRCWFELDDEVRPEAAETVHALRALGITVEIVSGDAAPAVERLAARLGIGSAVSRATPDSKLAHVRSLQAAGGVVLMVGDGVNDAPGLGGAEVAIAMGGGTDLARTRADAVLLREDLRAIPTAVRLARRTRRVIGENLAWAVAYNAVAVPLAAFGLVPPYWAAIGMSASSLVVVANAWKLGRAGDGATTVAA